MNFKNFLTRITNSTFSLQYLFLLFVFLGILSTPIFSQQPDTTIDAVSDTTIVADTTDTLRTLRPPSRSQIQGPIKYWADSISFSLPNQTTHLWGDVRIEYQNVTLTAGKVDIDWPQNVMVAQGIADSTDSLGNKIMTDYPVLTERGQAPINGIRLEYNFKNKRGKVLEGRTEMEPGYYRGEDIRKVGQETLFIKDGYFTTCELDTPHYYFRSDKTRMRLKKEAVAKPIVMYIADVPILAAPFWIFSLKRDRRSGIILPTFGETSFGGRYLKDFGYYWAPSQYWDLTMLATMYEETGLLYDANLRYNKRYDFSGNIKGIYSPKDVRTGAKRERWEIRFRHQQKIGQTLTINADGSFLSDTDFRRDHFSDFEQRTKQTIETNAYIRKTLPGSRTLSLNARRTENLQTERIDYTFPDLSFSQPSRSLFPRPSGAQQAWYHNLRYNYNSNLRSSGSKIPITNDAGEIIDFDNTRKSAWQHNVGASVNGKILQHFNFNQSLSFQELWAPEYLDYTFVDSLDDAVADTVEGFRARHTFNTSLATNTTFYGLWEIPFSPLKVIRHKVDPSIGFQFRPDFSKRGYGYFETFRDSSGNLIKRDRFAGNLFGGTPRGESRSMTFRVNNLFQGKIIKDGEEKKIDLFRMNFNTAYNFAADSLGWSDINTTLDARPHRNLSVSLRARHSFYKASPDGFGKIDEFVWSDGFQLPRLLDWNMTVNASLNLKPPTKEEAPQDTTEQEEVPETNIFQKEGGQLGEYDEFEEFKGFSIPWSVDMNFNYSYRQDQNDNITQRLNASINGRLQLTNKWKIGYSSRLDLIEREVVSQTFNIQRDLHCWEMNFRWSPDPNFSFYRLEIRIKEPILRDLKVTKTAGRSPF